MPGTCSGLSNPLYTQVLLERLQNETTRLTAVKGLMQIAQSLLSLDLSPVLEMATQQLVTFLRKSNQSLRHSSLTALDVRNSSSSIGSFIHSGRK